MAIGTAIGHLLVAAAGSEHLPRAAAGVVTQEGRRRRPGPGQAQAAVAGIHHEHHMLGAQAFGNVLDIGHRDRIAGKVGGARIHRDDVAQVTPGGQPSGGAMAGEEHEHPVIAAGAGIGQTVVEGGQDVVAGGLAIFQHDHLRGREAELAGQGAGNGTGVMPGMFERWPVRIVVDADDDCPGIGIGRGDGGFGAGGGTGTADTELAAVPAGELVTIGNQPVQDLRQRLDRALVDVMEQHDAALFTLHLLQHPLHDRFRHRVGPVHRIDVPHDRFQPGFGQQLHAFGIAGAVREAEQRRTALVDLAQQGIGGHHLVLQVLALAARELGVAEAVVAQGVALGTELAADGRHRTQPCLAILAHRAQVAADLEEHRRHVVALEDGDDFFGMGPVRAVIKAQHHSAFGQGAAEQLALAIVHRHRIGLDHAEVAQDRRAAVPGQQVGLVVLPFLPFQFDRPGALEAAENVREFSVVGPFDLGQCGQVLFHALAQLDRRQRGIGRQAVVQVAQHLDKGQPIGVIQPGVGFDVIQQAGQHRHPLRPAAVQQCSKPVGHGAALFQRLMEQLLANRGGGGAVAGRLVLLVGQQHDDAAVLVQQLLQCRQQCRVLGTGHGRRLGGGLRYLWRLVATGREQQSKQQPGHTQPRADHRCGHHLSPSLATLHVQRL